MRALAALLAAAFAAPLAGCPSPSVGVPQGPVSVTVLGEPGDPAAPGTPLQGAEVWFVRPDGEARLVLSGLDGVANGDLPEGSSVLVVRRRAGGSVGLAAFTAVGGTSPTAIVAGAPALAPAGPNGGSFFVAAEPWPGAAAHDLRLPCSNGRTGGPPQPQFEVTIRQGCQVFDGAVVGLAVDAGGGLLAWASLVNQPLPAPDGAVLALPGWQAPPDVTASVGGLPAAVAGVEVRWRNQGDGVVSWEARGATTPAAGTASLTAPMVPVGRESRVRTTLATSEPGSAAWHDRRIRPIAPTAALDASAGLLPWISAVTFDPAQRRVSWTESQHGAARAPDAAVARGSWTAAGALVSFAIFGPGGGGALAVPPLPAPLADLQPGPADSGAASQVLLIDVAGAAGWAAVVERVDPASRALASEPWPEVDEGWTSGWPAP